MKPAKPCTKRAAPAALAEHILLDCVLVVDDTDEFITEIRTVIIEKHRRADML